MSSARQRRCCSGFWKVKNRDMAVEEIIRDRRVAIMSGKLRGRRLFEVVERASEVALDWNKDEISSDCLNMLQKSDGENEELEESQGDLITYFDQSCPFSGSSLSDEKLAASKTVEEEGEMTADADAVKGGVSRNLRGVGGAAKCTLELAWFAIMSMLLTLGLVSMSWSGKYVLGKEVILVPT